MLRFLTPLVACAMLVACAGTPPKPAPVVKTPVPKFISEMRQLTFEGARAGEAYFSRDGKTLIFQSEREQNNPFYQIYLLDRASGVTTRVSPGRGKTTCAWIHPSGKRVLFASTHEDPEWKRKADEEWAERKAPKKRYNWSFDDAYDIFSANLKGGDLRNLTRTKGYDAEGSYSPDGQWIAFASNRAAYEKGGMSEEDAKAFARDPSYMMDIYIMRADGSQVKRLTRTPGYDGGPFFSPDGTRLTFRRFSPDGHTAEIHTMAIDGSDDRQLTRMAKMSWAPFYHPSGEYLIFASNREGYANFELFLVDVNGTKNPVRVTDLPGFDGLPVFSPDGSELVWTHTTERGDAQLFRAQWNDVMARQALGLPAPPPSTPAPSLGANADDARRWVEYLASEAFEGRPTGGAQEIVYASALADAFKAMGLKPAIGNSFLQKCEFTSGIVLEPGNALNLRIGGEQVLNTVERDWIPLSHSKAGTTPVGGAVFAGYGIVAPALEDKAGYDSYAGLEVKDQWVVVFAGMPEDIDNDRRFHLHLYARLQHKAMMARQNGALGLIVIDPSGAKDSPMRLTFEGRVDDSGLPVLRLSPAMADRLFKAVGTSRADWTTRLAKGELASLRLPGVEISTDIRLRLVKSQAVNVLAKLPAAGAKASVVVGAHLDHLGRGEGGNSLTPNEGKIHYGADDNASGVAGVLEIARKLSAEARAARFRPHQNLIFALWTGEEIGVLGSAHFMREWPARDRISAYLNLDMIGRLREEGLIVQGLGSASEWRSVIERLSARHPIKLITQDDPYLPTDALSFYMKKIPVVSAFTGSHSEYHTYRDTPATLNYKGLLAVADWMGDLASTLGGSATPLVKYRQVEGKSNLDRGRGFRLYLGTIPDYASEGFKGVKISGTNKGSPAERAGLLTGDVIVELGGMKVQNLQDYVYCLQALKAGEKTKLKILRAGAERDLEITPELKSGHQ